MLARLIVIAGSCAAAQSAPRCNSAGDRLCTPCRTHAVTSIVSGIASAAWLTWARAAAWNTRLYSANIAVRGVRMWPAANASVR